ncbi:MAG: rhodanese-like domain-containing protein [Myxococcota bacterium]
MGWFGALFGGGKDLGPEVTAALGRGAVVLDVRTPEEYAGGHVKGAKNIAVQVLAQRLGEVGPKDKPVIVYCRSGARSAAAANMLKAAGYTEVLDVGPMSAWPA